MGLGDYISRNPYQPAKTISKYDGEFIVAALSRIHTNAKLLQQKHNISAITLNKLYYENKFEVQSFSKQHTEHILNIDFAEPKLKSKDNMSRALQRHSAKSLLKQTNNFVSGPAQRVRLTTKNSALATRMHRSTQPSIKTKNSDSEHALHVCLTQNIASLAKQIPNQNSNHLNCIKVNSKYIYLKIN